jgi:non-canonical (house-cleaning) NTP pyrophosphatase
VVPPLHVAVGSTNPVKLNAATQGVAQTTEAEVALSISPHRVALISWPSVV